MKKIRKLVIPAAGFGTRFLPITKTIAKEMLPIIDKPTIQYIVEEAIESGIEEIIFITNPYKKTLEDYFDTVYELESRLEKSNKTDELKLLQDMFKGIKFYFIRQGSPKGTGHAVNLARGIIGDEPFAVAWGDDLVYTTNKPALRQLIDVYEKYDCNVIGGENVDRSIVNKYGIVKFSDELTGKIESIVEKPSIESAPSTFAGLGRYIVKPEIFDILDKVEPASNGEIYFPVAMAELMKTQDFYACRYDGKYTDVGSKAGYIKANIMYALNRDDIKDEVLEFIKNMSKNL